MEYKERPSNVGFEKEDLDNFIKEKNGQLYNKKDVEYVLKYAYRWHELGFDEYGRDFEDCRHIDLITKSMYDILTKSPEKSEIIVEIFNKFCVSELDIEYSQYWNSPECYGWHFDLWNSANNIPKKIQDKLISLSEEINQKEKLKNDQEVDELFQKL